MHASASTWVFNVVRELLIAAVGDNRVLTLYADRPDQIPDVSEVTGRRIVIKSHHGSVELDEWLAVRQAPIILSVRDPRDACIWMAQRFNAPLNQTAAWIINDCNRLLRLAHRNLPLLRYEDRFFDDAPVIERIAKRLSLSPSQDVVASIFAHYRTAAVRAFAQGIDNLPPERVQMVGAFKMDRVTQILAPHIGDGRDGKWYDLTPRLQIELTNLFGSFLDRFGYER
jgi:hypothetical protein